MLRYLEFEHLSEVVSQRHAGALWETLGELPVTSYPVFKMRLASAQRQNLYLDEKMKTMYQSCSEDKQQLF